MKAGKMKAMGETTFDVCQSPYEDRDAIFDSGKLALRTNESFALVSPNGSGKSTLMRMLAEDCRKNGWDDMRFAPGVLDALYSAFGKEIAGNPGKGFMFVTPEFGKERKSDFSRLSDQLFMSNGQEWAVNIVEAFKCFKSRASVSGLGYALLMMDDFDDGLSDCTVDDAIGILRMMEGDLKSLGIGYNVIIAGNTYAVANRMRCLDTRTFAEVSFDGYDGFLEYQRGYARR